MDINRRGPSRDPNGIEGMVRGSTHRTSEEHEEESDDLLPYCHQAQIDCGEAGHCCGADAGEKRVGVRHVVWAIGSV